MHILQKRVAIFALVLFAFGTYGVYGSVAQAQVSFGITIGAPPPVRVERARARRPGPDYVWVAGYWYPVRNRYTWHPGYWTRPPYAGARWIAPSHDGRQYFAGHWEGDRGRVEHEHSTDRNRSRDYRSDRRP